MRQLGLLGMLAACAVMAGCDDESTGPSNLPLVFTAQLAAQNEVPAVTNAESGARGAATITVVPVRDATGTITGGTFDFNFQLVGFPPDSRAILAHIHTGAAGVNGPVFVDTGLTPATAVPIQANGTATFNTTGLSPANAGAAINAIAANPAGYYFNVHTPLNPAGAVRGQLVRIQ